MKAIPIEELMATEGIKLSDEFYHATEVDAYRAKVRALVEAIKKYQEIAILVFECKYEDLAAVRERFELSCINLNAALAALESDNE